MADRFSTTDINSFSETLPQSSKTPAVTNNTVESVNLDTYIENLDTTQNMTLENVSYTKEELEIIKEEYLDQYQTNIKFFEELLEQAETMLKDAEDKDGILLEIENYLTYSVQPEYDYYKATYTDEEMQEKFGITQKEFSEMSLEEFVNYMKKYDPHLEVYADALDEMTERLLEGTDLTKKEDFETYKTSLENDIAIINLAIEKTKEAENNIDYNLLELTEEYQNFETTSLELDKNKLYEDGMVQGSTLSYTEYCYRNGDVNPLEFVKATKKMGIDSLTIYGYTGTNYEKVLELSDTYPEFEKKYSYLYETKGKKAADKYLENVENDLNMLMGQKQAQEFLSSLEGHENAEEKLENHLKTTGKGILDGMESWAEGVHSAGEAFASIFGYKASDVYSVNEYETMYILQALQEEEYGWLDNNYELSQSAGNLLPSVTLGILLTPGVGTFSVGVSAGGNSYHGGIVEGYSNTQSIVYGVTSGCSEALLQKYAGNLLGLNDVNITSLKTFASSMVKEGKEEFTQEWIDAGLRKLVFDEDIDAIETIKSSRKSAFYGAFLGGVFNSPNMALNRHNIKSINKQIEKGEINESEIITKIKEQYGEEVEGLSNEQIITEYSREIMNLIKTNQIKVETAKENVEKVTDAMEQAANQLEDTIMNRKLEQTTEYGALISGPFNGTNLAMNKYNINAINKRLNSGELLETQIQEFAQKYYPKETENMSTQKIVEEYSGEIVSLINAEQIKLQPLNINKEEKSSSQSPAIEEETFNQDVEPATTMNQENLNINNIEFESSAVDEKLASLEFKYSSTETNYELMKNVYEDNKNFSFSDFFDSKYTTANNGLGIGAVTVISPEQMIHRFNSTGIDSNNGMETPGLGPHIANYHQIIQAIYGTDSIPKQGVMAFQNKQLHDTIKQNIYVRYVNEGIDASQPFKAVMLEFPPQNVNNGKISSNQLESLKILKEQLTPLMGELTILGKDPTTGEELTSMDEIINAAEKITDDNQNYIKDKYELEFKTTQDTNLDNNLGEWTKKVLESTQIYENFDKLLEDVRQIDNISEEEHTKIKLEIIDTLVSSGKIKKLSNAFIHSLSKDSVMFERLIDTSIDSVANLTAKNLDNVPKLLIPTYQEISSKSFNKLFEHPEVRKCVTNLSVENYVEIIQIFKQKKIHKWIESKTLTEKLTNMSIEDFYKSMNKIGTIVNTIETGIKSENSQVCYDFLDKIAKKYYTMDILTSDSSLAKRENINIINNISYTLSLNEKQKYNKFEDVFYQLETTKKALLEKLRTQVINKSEVSMDNLFRVLDSNVTPEMYYDIIMEIDGEKKIVTTRNWDSNKPSLTTIIDEYIKSAFNGKLIIKEIIENKNKNTLVLTPEQGLKKGLNKVVLNIDGKQITKTVLSINGTYDFNNNNIFRNATTAEIFSITPIAPTLNQKVENAKSIYEVKYKMDNKVYTTYMISPTRFKSNPMLDIDYFVLSENIGNIEIVSVKELNDLSIGEKIKEKEKYITSPNLFSEYKYGGNQNDISDLVNKKLISNNELTLDEQRKYQLLSDLSKKYFPNITDIEFLNIADEYSKSGCGYMAIANAFTTYMEGQKNGQELFKEKIGFDLKSDDTNYNVDALAFDIWLNYWSNWDKLKTINPILELPRGTGIGNISISQILNDYFPKRGINVNIKINDCTSLTNAHNELLSILANNSEYYNILSSENFDLELLSTSNNNSIVDAATVNSKMVGTIKKDVGGHAMLITDIDENNNLIVSSWSEKYRFIDTSPEQHLLKGDKSSAGIWSIKFSLDSMQQDIKESVNEINVEQRSNQTYNAEESRTGLLRENYYINQQVPYIKNVILTMNIKYNGIGLKLLEKYLMDGNIGHITRDNNCRSYISSLTKEDLTKALNIIIDDQKLHEKIEIPNNLKPWEAKNMYNSLYNTITSNNDYNEYMAYVNNCKQQGIPYFFNYQLLEIQNQLQQLLNQFSFQKKYFSLKTNYDIFKYFGNIGDALFPQLISEVERMSSYSQTPISAQDLAKVKDINYLEYIFANPTQNLANYLNSMGYANNGINNWNKQSIINYLKVVNKESFYQN